MTETEFWGRPLEQKKSTLRGCLEKLRRLQHEWGDRARAEGLPDTARSVYFEVETNLSRALGELDYLINLADASRQNLKESR